jgi:hypothetical protein
MHLGHLGVGASDVGHIDEDGVCANSLARFTKSADPTCPRIVSVYAGEEKKEHKWGLYRDKGLNVLREPPFNIGHALLNSSDMDPVSEPGQ